MTDAGLLEQCEYCGEWFADAGAHAPMAHPDEYDPTEVCAYCGDRYLPTTSGQQYCSQVCANGARQRSESNAE